LFQERLSSRLKHFPEFDLSRAYETDAQTVAAEPRLQKKTPAPKGRRLLDLKRPPDSPWAIP
jgi:hypothetical protein